MKIAHTADWHLGQVFKYKERTQEHEAFLQFLLGQLQQQKIDALLVSGDVFDSPNPSSAAVKLLYDFLRDIQYKLPKLQVIITAGNHDSALVIERPKPLLERSNIHVIGAITRVDTEVEFSKFVRPLVDADGKHHATCIAIPFIRASDVQSMDYVAGIKQIYKDALLYAQTLGDVPIVAMGHLTVSGTYEKTDAENTVYIGGEQGIDATCFSNEIDYVALGHIHKNQKIGDNIYYSGSPMPLSFSEINYKHAFNIYNTQTGEVTKVAIPLTRALLRVPNQAKTYDEVVQELVQLPDNGSGAKPLLMVQIKYDEPIPELRQKIEKLLVGKYVELVNIHLEKATASKVQDSEANQISIKRLDALSLAQLHYKQKFDKEMPQNLIDLFTQVLAELNTQEDR